MAEGPRLDELCRLRNLPDLGRAIFPGAAISNASDFQKWLVQDLIQEISGCLKCLDANAGLLVEWLRTQFQLENLKVLLRGFLNQTPLETLLPRLIDLPAELELDATALIASRSLEELIARLPAEGPHDWLRTVVRGRAEPPSAFILEAALDAGYFRELLTRMERLPGNEREIIRPMIIQEVNIFQFMLATRGKFHLGFSAEILLPLRVTGGDWYNSLLSAPDISAAASSAVGLIIDRLPVISRADGEGTAIDLSTIEALSSKHYLRLANGVFRRSHMGIGAVVGYFGVRRMEIANLVTLSEGIRLGLNERQLRARMMPQNDREVAYV
jgi:vacuolar-type H+-ATPase subunit C/Vma6